jgi:hypothetical protein
MNIPVFSEPAPDLPIAKTPRRKNRRNNLCFRKVVAARGHYSLRALSPQAADFPNAPTANRGRLPTIGWRVRLTVGFAAEPAMGRVWGVAKW